MYGSRAAVPNQPGVHRLLRELQIKHSNTKSDSKNVREKWLIWQHLKRPKIWLTKQTFAIAPKSRKRF